jgi:hypothetical protein
LQEWSTNAALASYLRSDLYRTILAIMESASEPPELRFDMIGQTGGVEVVKVVRGVAEASENRSRGERATSTTPRTRRSHHDLKS